MLRKTRERYREELRQTILDAARKEFAERGYEGVSMRTLADKVGCSHGSLYLYFQDKEAIFDALVRESFDQLGERLRGIVQEKKTADPVRLMKKLARAYVDFGLENPVAYAFAFVLRRPHLAKLPDKPHAAYLGMRELVKRCIEEQRFVRTDPDTASQALWAAVHGVTSLLISRPAFPWKDRDAVIRRVIDGAVNALVAK